MSHRGIMITGGTAQQCQLRAHERSATFAGLLKDAYQDQGHNVFLQPSTFEMSARELDKFDHVLVGLTPLMSLAATYVYGSLHVLREMWGSPKLKLFIDAPEPYRIAANLRSIALTPEALVKPFFSYRRDYAHALSRSAHESLMEVVYALLDEPWPTTLVPMHPWVTVNDVADIGAILPEQARSSLAGVVPDAAIAAPLPHARKADDPPFWLAEATTRQLDRWLDVQRVEWPVRPIPTRGGESYDGAVYDSLNRSSGLLIPTQSMDSAWWSPRVYMGVSSGVPVCTNWQVSQRIGSSWRVLPDQIETLSASERQALADAQRADYINALPSREDIVNDVEIAFKRRRAVTQ